MRPLHRALLLVGILACAFASRLSSLDGYASSPDDGNYLVSARVLSVDGTRPLADWIAEDRAWFDGPSSYPHSYLHQLVTRWCVRAGFGMIESVRLGSAVLGALTALLPWGMGRARAFSAPNAAVWAAAFVAFSPVHAWYARTGWGQTGCTFFWLLWFALGARLFFVERPGALRSLALGVGMALASLAAWGYHEMMAVYVATMGLWTIAWLVQQGRRPGEILRRAVASPTGLALVLAATPVVILTARLRGQPFAEELWLNASRSELGGYWRQKRLILEDLFLRSQVHAQLGWTIALLAVWGFVALRRERPRVAYYGLVHVVAPCLIFFFFFQDGNLVRIYLPVLVVACVFAGFGLADALRRAAARSAVLAAALGVIAVGLPALVTAQTVFGDAGAPFARTSFYENGRPSRGPLEPIEEWLRQHRGPGELLGVCYDHTPLFVLRGHGISSRYQTAPELWQVPQTELPHWLIAVKKLLRRDKRTIEDGGVYELLVTSDEGRFGLYVNRARLPRKE